MLNGASALETTEFMASKTSTCSERRRPTTTTRSVGPTRWIRRTNGRSRSPRTGAGPGTAPIVHWPRGFTARGEVRSQFHHVIDVAPTVLEVAGLTRAHGGGRCVAETDRGREHDVYVRRRVGGRSSPYAVLRDVLQPWIYHEGWSAVTRHSTPWVMAPGFRRSTRTSGSSTTRTRTGARAESRRGDAGEARRAQGAVPRGGSQVRGPAARRSPGRALQSRPCR